MILLNMNWRTCKMFKLRIETGNDAFVPDKGVEVVVLLKEVTEKVSNGYTEGTIHDTNGGRVGEWTLTNRR